MNERQSRTKLVADAVWRKLRPSVRANASTEHMPIPVPEDGADAVMFIVNDNCSGHAYAIRVTEYS